MIITSGIFSIGHTKNVGTRFFCFIADYIPFTLFGNCLTNIAFPRFQIVC